MSALLAAIAKPLPFRGGGGVGTVGTDRPARQQPSKPIVPTPNPSPEGEGLKL